MGSDYTRRYTAKVAELRKTDGRIVECERAYEEAIASNSVCVCRMRQQKQRQTDRGVAYRSL
jgi:hypothetical protein